MKKLIIIFVGVIIFTSQVMAVVTGYFSLMASTGMTSTTTGSAQNINDTSFKLTRFVARLVAINNSGTTPTANVIVEHSPDNSSWKTLATFSEVTTGSSTQEIHITPIDAVVFSYVRAKATLAGTSPNYNIDVKLYFDPNS